MSDTQNPYFMFMNLTESHLLHKIPHGYFPDDLPASKLDAINQQAMDYYAGIVEPEDSDMTTLRRSYRATLRYLDDQLGRLFDAIDLTDTTIALVSDHGEHFGEYGRFAHQYGLREELIHVPMIVRTPQDQPETIDGQVELRQLYRFLLSAANGQIELPEPMPIAIAECHSPAPDVDELCSRGDGDLPEYVTTYDPGVRGVTDGQLKFVEFPNGSTELYALNAEGQDISKEEPKKASELKAELDDKLGPFEVSRSSSLDVSNSVESQLADLGYT
jgi:arylsulfatase A-like enzyme